MSTLSECNDKITKAKTKMVIRFPFFSIIALGLIFKEGQSIGIYLPTMGTDGKYCLWNAEFVLKLTLDELIGVIAHEVLHCVFMHMLRRGNRDPLLWNIACDYAINHIVIEAGMTLPADRLWEDKYKGWLVDKIYDDLVKNQPPVTGQIWIALPGEGQPGCDDGQPGSGNGGDDDRNPEWVPGHGKGKDGKKRPLWGTIMEPRNEDGTALSEAQKSEFTEDLKMKVLQAAEAAKAIGKLPHALKGLIKAVGQPQVNWKEYIQSWVSGKTPDDYTWRKPQKKMLALYNMVMPSVQLNGSGIGVLDLDTSGSETKEELIKYVTEIIGVIEICNPDKLYIMQHDVKVNRCDVWEPGDTFESLTITHRGGTCCAPSFKYVQEQIEDQIDWMICFTDMEINDFPRGDAIPDYPVLWAATGPDNAPFGTYISLRDALSAVS